MDTVTPITEDLTNNDDPTYKISDKASSILAENNNNYLLFLEQAKIKQKKIDDKLELDLVSAKRQVKWFYPFVNYWLDRNCNRNMEYIPNKICRKEDRNIN